MDTTITSSVKLGVPEVAHNNNNNENGNDIVNVNEIAGTIVAGTFVIRMFVNPFTIFGLRISPGHYQTKLPPLLQQSHIPETNQGNCVGYYQLQEWIKIWKRIQTIQYEHPGYLSPTSMIILLISYLWFLIHLGLYLNSLLVVYSISVTLMSVYCYVKHREGTRYIVRYRRNILVFLVFANIKANIVLEQFVAWQWYYQFFLVVAITLTPIVCIQLCILFVNAFYHYHDQHDKVLRQFYYNILSINDGVTYFTLRPKVGFHASNVAVDVYTGTGKQENGIHHLSSTTITTTVDVQKSPNCSNDSVNDPLFL